MSKRSTPRGSALADRPTMADIARRAGVSVSTVSRALGGSALVTAETRARIAQLAGSAGYVPNQVARGLRLQRSRQILVILPTIANPFFGEIVLGIEEEAQAHGYGVLVGNTMGDQAREDGLGRHLMTGAVDGVVLLTGRVPAPLAENARDRVVTISERVRANGVAHVSIDNDAAADAAVGHLLALGHRRIAHITGRSGSSVAEQRKQAYRAALLRAGIEAPESWIAGGTFTFESGEAAMHRLLDLPERPSAVFCSSDEMAIGAVKAARSRALDVPRELSICGFDDIPFAAAFEPPLTTIRQPRRAMGRNAAAMLIDRLADARTPRRDCQLPYELIVRASTVPPARPA
jgi:LacI family repressor for deo operon, udp, cdd, tsx, nupC, and nupG